jgi:hypothetical protein
LSICESQFVSFAQTRPGNAHLHQMLLLFGQLRNRYRRPPCRSKPKRGEAVVADTSVTRSRIGKRDPQGRHCVASQGTGGIQQLSDLHPGKPQAGCAPDNPRPMAATTTSAEPAARKAAKPL